MYYPYFRSKQFDLLALQALLDAGRFPEGIIPIIEPVKQNKALLKLIAKFQAARQPFYLIVNPQVGEFATEEGLTSLEQLAVEKAFILDQPLESLENSYPLIITQSPQIVLESDWQQNQSLVLVPEEFRLLAKIKGPKILSQDGFTRLGSNSYYTEVPDELIFESNKKLALRGFSGFSDFSIDSRIYYEHGYPSKRLALHLIYMKDGNVRIHHFVSEELPTQKENFLQVMAEIKGWQEQLWEDKMTLGGEILFEAFKRGHFPGMGVLRKASVMHQLEIMGRFLGKDV
ncbi:sce7725 family protein [Enterococcus sp. LJL90]